jgi:hypothetical protein
MGLGSIISQATIEHRELVDLDWDRIIRFAAFGYLFAVKKFDLFFRFIEFDLLGSICSLLVLWFRKSFFEYKIKTN